MIGWRKLLVTTALATVAAVALDRMGIVEKLANLIP